VPACWLFHDRRKELDMDNKEDKIVEKKEAGKLSEETLHIIANLVITTISTAALVVSIMTGMKGKRRG